jgi:polynucleotide 5'-hydroxyl-kinase GRC3/NOL9
MDGGRDEDSIAGKKRPREEKSPWTAQWKHTKSAVVELMQKDSSVSIAGRGSVRCLHGRVWGHGFLLQEDAWYSFDCPQWSSWLVLHSESDTATLEIRHREMGETASDAPSPPDSQGPMLPQHLSEDGTASFSLYDTDNPSSRPTHVLPEWRDTVDRILKDPNPTCERQNGIQPCIIAVAGAKGVGKSTFVRYLVHRFLSQPQPLYVLDGDTGQAEFGPPGLLTLTYLKGVCPLWSLPHNHMLIGGLSNPKNPLAPPQATQTALFFGGVTSELDPGRYLESLSHLIAQYKDAVSGTAIPLVVNLDGWVKGLGFQVLSSFLLSHAASHIVQINGTNATQQVDLSVTVPGSLSCIHTLPSFSSVLGTSASPALSVPSSAWRDLRFVHYWLNDPCLEVDFSQNDLIKDSDGVIASRLASQKPYMVPWESVQCQRINGVPLLPEMLNGCIIGLCKAGSFGRQNECVGLGIIRSIDLSRRMFYVLTPVQPSILPLVNLFVVGNLCLPMECIRLGDKSNSFPFQSETSVATDIVGSLPMRSRKNILRKGVNA